MRILGAALGNDVHVGGVVNFLRLAEKHGYETRMLGPAVPVARLIEAVHSWNPDIVAVSYRLTPENAKELLQELKAAVDAEKLHLRMIFGGTPQVAAVARELNLFEVAFDGSESPEAIEGYLHGKVEERGEETYAQSLVDRIAQRQPYPLLRHHFGRPDLEETIRGCAEIAEARVLDVISVAPDQNAQEFFFRPEEMRPELNGAGGVPVRKPEDLRAIYGASRCGNYPLLRCYSGTTDQIKWADMLIDTINIAWGAVPLFWYGELDGRSRRSLETTIRENQQTMAHYASRGVPVEVNDSHHWSLRSAPDSVAVAAAFLAAHNAKAQGVRHYIAQYMFNTPPGTSPAMDLAKMLAKVELVETLKDGGFTIYRECRSGLTSLPLDMDMAKGQLGSSIHTMMALQPHIVHVVGYSEANYAVGAKEVIESCKIAHGAIRNALLGQADPLADPNVRKRKDELVAEARLILGEIREMGAGIKDAWSDPHTLAQAVKAGILDAPHLMGNPAARGTTVTQMIDGASRVIDPATGRPMTEAERLKWLGVL